MNRTVFGKWEFDQEVRRRWLPHQFSNIDDTAEPTVLRSHKTYDKTMNIGRLDDTRSRPVSVTIPKTEVYDREDLRNI